MADCNQVMDGIKEDTISSDLPNLLTKPFHFLIQEQAKCMVAIKELQDQVQSLFHFRRSVTKVLPEVVGGGGGGGGSRSTIMHYRPGQGEVSSWTAKSHTSTAGRMLPTIRDGSPPVVHFPSPRNKMSPASLQHSSSSAESVELGEGSAKSSKNIKQRNGGSTVNVGPPSQKFVVVAQGKNWLRIRPYSATADSELEDSDEPLSTSDSLRSDSLRDQVRRRRQGDSGFSTEPQGDRSLAWFGCHGKDELLSLLQIIENQSVELRTEVERLRQQTEVPILQAEEDPTTTSSSPPLPQHPPHPAADCLRKERDQLAERLLLSEEQSLAAHIRATQLEDRLRTAATEREQLDSRIHGMHVQFVRSSNTSSPGRRDFSEGGGSGGDSGGATSLPDGLLRGKVHVKPNTARLTSVLRETRVVELQRQLLAAVMENEVLKTQMQQVSKDWSRRSREWQREVDWAQHETRTAKAALDRARVDVQSEKARLRMLQRALQSATPATADATLSSLSAHLLQSLQALGHSVDHNSANKATNTDRQWCDMSNGMISKPELMTNGIESSSSSSISPPVPVSESSLEILQKNWTSNTHLVDLDVDVTREEEKAVVNGQNNGGRNGLTKSCGSTTTDPAIQQRIQNFLQRIAEQIAPMETLPDDKDYLETGL